MLAGGWQHENGADIASVGLNKHVTRDQDG